MDYRMRFARSPASVGDVGHRNGRTSESDAAAPSVGRHRSHRIDAANKTPALRCLRATALVSESHGGVGNRMSSRPSRRDSAAVSRMQKIFAFEVLDTLQPLLIQQLIDTNKQMN